ncbi:YceI family protein [Winogradskyella sp. A3E31]|uniref:YceI family protein n=1 Tax=Winogradskyella sp. A3E31 TaxID=3349637 RepID=UPI00398B80AC
MKTTVLTLITVLGFTLGFAQENLTINTEKSTIHWIGEYAFYFGGHEGNINFKEGYFLKNKDGMIYGGEFTIDMNSIVCTDNGKIDKDSGLVEHLKNEDFFEVNTYPTSKLVITDVRYETSTRLKIYANLTIKDITKRIDFRAEVDYDKQQMSTKFKIDRTLWGITFNSKEVEGKLKDGLISDAIGFEVDLRL